MIPSLSPQVLIQPKHLNKATGNFSQRLLALPIPGWRMPDRLAEERAERSEAFEADFETDISDAQAAPSQQFLGFLDPFLNQVLMWRRVERIAKEAQEMIPRHARLL